MEEVKTKHKKKSEKNKTMRILEIYTRLMNGHGINKSEKAKFYNVNTRSIQRDIEDIRRYLSNEAANTGFTNSIKYDRSKNIYRFEQSNGAMLSKSEALAVCKILLDSRAFTKKEMERILDRLTRHCLLKSDQKQVEDLIINEKYCYV